MALVNERQSQQTKLWSRREERNLKGSLCFCTLQDRFLNVSCIGWHWLKIQSSAFFHQASAIPIRCCCEHFRFLVLPSSRLWRCWPVVWPTECTIRAAALTTADSKVTPFNLPHRVNFASAMHTVPVTECSAIHQFLVPYHGISLPLRLDMPGPSSCKVSAAAIRRPGRRICRIAPIILLNSFEYYRCKKANMNKPLWSQLGALLGLNGQMSF